MVAFKRCVTFKTSVSSFFFPPNNRSVPLYTNQPLHRFDDDELGAQFGKFDGSRKPAAGATTKPSAPIAPTQIVLLDKRQSQNIAIILKSLATPRTELVHALRDGNELPIDVLEKLTNIALTKDEEDHIRGFSGDPSMLSDAESFLAHLLHHVPVHPFSRFDTLLLRATYANELANARSHLATLEAACLDLKPDRDRRGRSLLVKLLEAVPKAGNKMNQGTARGNAKAFNLSSLRKLSDIKAANGKTTLLHFLVEQVTRSEGRRVAFNQDPAPAGAGAPKSEKDHEYIALGLPLVGALSSELANVKKAALIDHDVLINSLTVLEGRMRKTREFLAGLGGSDGGSFVTEMQTFLDVAEKEVQEAVEEKERVLDLLRKTTDYYQPGTSKDRNSPPLQLLVIIKDFLGMVDQACATISRNIQQTQLKKKQQEVTTAAKLAAGGSSLAKSRDGLASDSKRMSEDDGEVGRTSMPRFPNLNVPSDWDSDDND